MIIEVQGACGVVWFLEAMRKRVEILDALEMRMSLASLCYFVAWLQKAERGVRELDAVFRCDW